MARLLRSLFLVVVAAVPTACGNLNFFSPEEEAQLGAEAYAQAIAEYPVVTGTPAAAMVERVGRRIAAASGIDFDWEFKLLKADDTVNAFCLPGGKVAIYTGILPITQDEDGLAVVMGHEVAHATERHGGKRMTQMTIAQAAMAAVDAGLGFTEMSAEAREGVLTAFGVGAQVGLILPYSRDHETEADVVGLRFVIRAGYDPWAAPKLWERMAALGGGGTPEFLSTHPNPENRAAHLREIIPQLLAEEGSGLPR